MSTLLMVVVVVVIVAIVAGAGFLIWRQARTQRLRRQFGPEYDHAIDSHQNRREAERELHDREQRHQELDIRPLEPQARERYQQQWTQVQEHFVDAPEAAVEQGDRLVIIVMGERGYPMEDFDDRVASLSVEHGRMLDHYRRGHDISLSAGRKEASTEELRQAMVHYRALFEDLLAVPREQDGTAAPADRAQVPGEPSEPAPRDRTVPGRTATDRTVPGRTATDQTATDGPGDEQAEREQAERRQAPEARSDRTDAVSADPRERGRTDL
ncbi:MAG: hypothetical protein JWL58_1285 [Streptosporangiaceae bacterium]|jgi:hypothetical protein|nr:hypothetical protein [Streptosporangiaceae bacterium]